ncbi:hypothetical protein F5Y18DRAFT_374223 [Xylariaceae sp. FL1019]|nr:hypothetical protein F5Y18DRAFT_374223 [Xylariaceae sp. FL1019]
MMDVNQGRAELPVKGHSRNKSGARPSRPRSSTKGPLDDADEIPTSSPLSPQIGMSGGSTRQHTSPRASLSHGRSPVRASTPVIGTSVTARDFSFLLNPEIYHQISPLNMPPPFRSTERQPDPETPVKTLLASGHFRAAAIAAAQELTGSSPLVSPGQSISPTDHIRIFNLFYIRLSCLCLIDAVPLAAQEAKALEDLNSAIYTDPETGVHLAPWELRILAVRLQTIGFGDPRRAVMIYYELAREARNEVVRAGKAHDHSAAEKWKIRLGELGIKVADVLIEMDDLEGAAAHLQSLANDSAKQDSHLNMCRALLWLHLGDIEAARRGLRADSEDTGNNDLNERVMHALADMADGDYEAALVKWRVLQSEVDQNEMVSVNLAVCLLYTGKMFQGRDILEDLVEKGYASHTLLFNLTTMYELCTDRSKSLKMKLIRPFGVIKCHF